MEPYWLGSNTYVQYILLSSNTKYIIVLKQNNMKSPITGKKMILKKEKRSIAYKNETFEIVFHCYKCVNSGEQFTTTELDEINMDMLYKQYNDKHQIK
ncbi:MAG: hypothetical protein WC446_08045 [Candidatus Paceibacterota bacterium]